MNEEQAVLDFFAQQENLPLALAVADLVDQTRERMNNEFWSRLAERMSGATPAWQVAVTEDRNAPDSLVGLYLQPSEAQALYLRPMLEQQIIGGTPRIYFGVMWSATPGTEKKGLDEVNALRNALAQEGFKSNDSFLAWQWSPYLPRSKKFLIRLSTSGDSLIDEAAHLLLDLLKKHGTAVDAANRALREGPRNITISLESLRSSPKPGKTSG